MVYKINEFKNYEAGDLILQQGIHSSNIFIIAEGEVQVRVARTDMITGKVSDYWLGNLQQGSCFNVYNCLSKSEGPLVSYYAKSKFCHIDCIDSNDLFNMSNNLIDLHDQL